MICFAKHILKVKCFQKTNHFICFQIYIFYSGEMIPKLKSRTNPPKPSGGQENQPSQAGGGGKKNKKKK